MVCTHRAYALLYEVAQCSRTCRKKNLLFVLIRRDLHAERRGPSYFRWGVLAGSERVYRPAPLVNINFHGYSLAHI